MPEDIKPEEEIKTLDDAMGGESRIVDDSGKPPEKTWTDHGIDGWDDLSNEDIAGRVLKERGSQSAMTQERDTLRAERDSLKSQMDQISGVTNPQKKEIKEEIAQMNEYEKAQFFAELETSPRKALSGLLKDHMGVTSKDDIQKMIDDSRDQSFASYDKYSQTEIIKRQRPEYAEHERYIEFISKPEHLGDTRPYEDKLDFAVLRKENKELADVVYDILARTNMPFADAKEYAELRMTAKGVSENSKNKLRKTVKDVKKSMPEGGQQKGSEDEKIEDMDDAFDVKD